MTIPTQTQLPDDWIIPAWSAPKNVRALITTRNGGVSQGQYAGANASGGMNLGLRCGDQAAAVHANRALLREYLPAAPYWLRQVHGTTVLAVASQATAPESEPLADGSYTDRPGQVCVALAADCLPILLTNQGGQVVAAIHAGWRGLAAGIVEHTVARLHAVMDASKVPDGQRALMAYLGPAIGPQAFVVGIEVWQAFTDFSAAAAAHFVAHPQDPDKFFADLFALARQRLLSAGVTRVDGGGLCTVSHPQRFYSFRREQTTGRMAALIWLVN